MNRMQIDHCPGMRVSLRYLMGRNGFTLVEILVSMTILSLILLTLGSMVGVVTQTWLNGINAGNNYTKARTMLTILDRDTQTMFLRRDLAAFTDSTGTLSLCSFYSAIQGQPAGGLSTPDTRAVSLVQYSLVQMPTPAAATSSTLQRLDCGMNFQTAGITPTVGYNTNMIQLANAAVTALPPENVADGVIAFQWQFVDGTGGLITPPYVPAGTTGSAVPFLFNFAQPSAVYNPRSLVVSLIVVSDNAYQLALKTGTLGKLIAQFPTQMPAAQTTTPTGSSTTYSTETFAKYWSGLLNPTTGTFASGAGLPKPVIASGSIQVFERHIPLPLTTPSN